MFVYDIYVSVVFVMCGKYYTNCQWDVIIVSNLMCKQSTRLPLILLIYKLCGVALIKRVWLAGVSSNAIEVFRCFLSKNVYIYCSLGKLDGSRNVFKRYFTIEQGLFIGNIKQFWEVMVELDLSQISSLIK